MKSTFEKIVLLANQSPPRLLLIPFPSPFLHEANFLIFLINRDLEKLQTCPESKPEPEPAGYS